MAISITWSAAVTHTQPMHRISVSSGTKSVPWFRWNCRMRSSGSSRSNSSACGAFKRISRRMYLFITLVLRTSTSTCVRLAYHESAVTGSGDRLQAAFHAKKAARLGVRMLCGRMAAGPGAHKPNRVTMARLRCSCPAEPSHTTHPQWCQNVLFTQQDCRHILRSVTGSWARSMYVITLQGSSTGHRMAQVGVVFGRK